MAGLNIALHNGDGDCHKFPNVALMKLSAYHKKRADKISFFNPLFAATYDLIYSSKVFSFTDDDPFLPSTAIKGGPGYKDFAKRLPKEIESICPDYSLYNLNRSCGRCTIGCIRSCPWCLVPKYEGKIRPYADIEEFARHEEVILMDNNILASEYGLKQIEKIIKLKLKVDFNQGLDARLIDTKIAKLLSQVRWLEPVRLACDTISQMDSIFNAVKKLRWENCTPQRYKVYMLVTDDIEDALERVRFLKALNLDPHAQPYRDFENKAQVSDEQRAFCNWVNIKKHFRSCSWEEYARNPTVKKAA